MASVSQCLTAKRPRPTVMNVAVIKHVRMFAIILVSNRLIKSSFECVHQFMYYQLKT